eukprot:Nk52_evm8s2474 gene=Nk52_evmTU8s2474
MKYSSRVILMAALFSCSVIAAMALSVPPHGDDHHHGDADKFPSEHGHGGSHHPQGPHYDDQYYYRPRPRGCGCGGCGGCCGGCGGCGGYPHPHDPHPHPHDPIPTVTVTVVDPKPTDPPTTQPYNKVVGFNFVAKDGEYKVPLFPGTTIDLSIFPVATTGTSSGPEWTIEAVTDGPAPVSKVDFYINGYLKNTDYAALYFLCGESTTAATGYNGYSTCEYTVNNGISKITAKPYQAGATNAIPGFEKTMEIKREGSFLYVNAL